MRRLSVISFTQKGKALSERVSEIFDKDEKEAGRIKKNRKAGNKEIGEIVEIEGDEEIEETGKAEGNEEIQGTGENKGNEEIEGNGEIDGNGDSEAEDLEGMGNAGLEVRLYTKCKACAGDAGSSSVETVAVSLGEWTKEQMRERNALLFIGACGIAVRAVSPFLTDKLHDPPVLVMDEKGRYVIPILSGHMGGANELAACIAERTGAEPVITTATDLEERFAVDLFAKKNGLYIGNKDGIAKVSAKILSGQEITVSIEPGHGAACPPEGIRLVPYPPGEPVDIAVTSQGRGPEAVIALQPKEYIIGMGCKRGKQADEIARFVEKKLAELGISDTQVYALSSISQKSHEPGLMEWCQRKGVLFLTYTAEELWEAEGEFQKSAFVMEQVGVDNVCERAALRACVHGGKLVCKKCAENGMTIAVARRQWTLQF